MGLRERNALHTRTWIANTALDLFEQQGYDATTLEEVAARAEVSVSTLYRYYPTKDSLLVDHPGIEVGALARAFRDRPATESVAQALGAAVLAALGDVADTPSIVLRVRAVIDRVPVARSRMWDYAHNESALLAKAVQERMGSESAVEEAAFAAELAFTVVLVALRNTGENALDARASGRRLIALLADPAVLERVIPRT